MRLLLVVVLGATLASACQASSLGPLGGHSGAGGAGGNWRAVGGAGGDPQELGGAQGGGGVAVSGDGGRSDAGVSAGCQPPTSDDGVITWDENGEAQCGIVAAGTGTTDSARNLISLTATTAGGKMISILVLDVSGLGGVYSCKNDASVNDLYVNLTYSAGALQDCTITIASAGTSGGAPATGTFAATLTGADGEAIDLTNGAINSPVFLPPP